jgi:selenide, water dikinase
MKRLTEYSSCAGCAGKFAAGELTRMLGDIPPSTDDRVVVDFSTGDDAGVYRWSGGPALVQTVDFFTPIVDDPYAYGQIAAANALSDVYAMGGVPRTALAIAALPKDGPGRDVIREIFRGGYDKLVEAGVALLGGHTVADPEIKLGYAVTGEVDPARVLTNARARIGDALILTKPLGTGIITTAAKFLRASETELAGAVRSMRLLNRDAAAAIGRLPANVVSACTDVTGFGLTGHASAMALASGVSIVFDTTKLAVLEGALDLALTNVSGGSKTNDEHFGPRVRVHEKVNAATRRLAFDPQTSGGLLVAVDPGAADGLIAEMREAGVDARRIGQVDPPDPAGILVTLT